MLPLGEILNACSGLVQDLPRYSRWHTVRLLAGLLTRPEYHANTVRLEAMVHLGIGVCAGEMRPARTDLQAWLNEHLEPTHLRFAEDPIEDVFVTNVVNGTGNHRVFGGIWESNDYWLQSLLRVLPFLPEKADYQKMVRSVDALLDLSEAVAERNGLTRNIAGAGEATNEVELPPMPELEQLGDRVVFSDAELRALGINSYHLKPFVLPDREFSKILASANGDSLLERQPLLRDGASLLVALPAAFSIAIRRFVLETVSRNRDLLRLDRLLNEAQVISVQGALDRLHGLPWRPPDFPKPSSRGLASLTLLPFRFDADKIGVLIMVHPPLSDALKFGFSNSRDLSEAWAPLNEDFRRLTDALANAPGYRAGLCLILMGGIGAGFAIRAPELDPSWQIASFSVPNFLTLSVANDVDLAMIWRFAAQRSRVLSRRIRLLNPNGDFNLIASWKDTHYSLLPKDAPANHPGLILAVPTNALLDLRQRTRQALDFHVAKRPRSNSWLEVERKTAFALFKRLRRMPFFVASPSNPELLGVIETPGAGWWVTLDERSEQKHVKSTVFQIWDCFGHWLPAVGKALSDRFTPSGFIGEFRLKFPGVDDWEDRIASDSKPEKSVPLSWQLLETKLVEVTITQEFFHTFMQPKNLAEREIVRGLLDAGAAMLGESLPPLERDVLCDRIIPVGNARHFHVMAGHDVTYAVYQGPADAFHIREEVVAEVIQDLGQRLAPDKCGYFTEDPAEVRKLIHSAVARLKDDIAQQLSGLNMESVVRRCLIALDHIHRDEHRWKISAAALLALNPDSTEVLGEAHDQELQRSAANVAARILIETALFSCSRTGGRPVSDSDLHELLARTQHLIGIADYDLAQRAGFPVGRISLSHSGELRVSNDFLDQLRLDYTRNLFEDGYTAAARTYAGHFQSKEGYSPPPEFGAFNAALIDEIGLTAEQAVEVGSMLHTIGINAGKAQLILLRSTLAEQLAPELALSPEDTERAIAALSIFPRSAWDKELPDNCTYHDVQPWRFKRRYSILRRPFVQLTLDPDPLLMVSPLLVREALRYLIDNAFVGEFSPEFFRSAKMRSYQGGAVNRRGRRFELQLGELMRAACFKAEVRLLMPKFGASPELGDIDVLAWRERPQPEIFVIEAKALRNARSTAEILSQLDEFRGEARDFLAKHHDRMIWLAMNRSALAKFTGLSDFALRGFVATSHRVPMQFLTDSQGTDFIAFNQLKQQFPPANRSAG